MQESQIYLLDNVERHGRIVNTEQKFIKGAHIKIDYIIFGEKMYKIIIVNSEYVDYSVMAKRGRKKKNDGN